MIPTLFFEVLMALTLIESAKLAANNGEVKRAGVIATYAEQSAWLASMVWNTIAGNSYGYSRELTLPGIAFRGVNGSYTESTGIVNPLSETLKIAGGDLDVDAHIIRTLGMGVRAKHESMKAKALAAEITRVMIKGDSTTAGSYEFDGLQNRVVGAQKIANGASDGGNALSLAQLDAAIDAVPGANAIWLSRAMRLKFNVAARTSSVAGNINYVPDQFGRQQMTYAGLPLLVPYPENDGVEPLAFDELGSTGSTATATSIYVVRIGDGYLSGIQSGAPLVTDLGQLQTAPVYRTRVEWDVSIVVEHPKAVSRLYGISNAAIAA